MKSSCVILVSLLLWVTQCLALTPANHAQAAATATTCCPPAQALRCSAQCCVVNPTVPTNPIPDASLPRSVRTALHAPGLLEAKWAVANPAGPLRILPPAAFGAAERWAVPLFIRHAAILI